MRGADKLTAPRLRQSCLAVEAGALIDVKIQRCALERGYCHAGFVSINSRTGPPRSGA
jgi:hypothetical protein